MSGAKACPGCGAPLPANRPGFLCAGCFARAMLAEDEDFDLAAPVQDEPGVGQFGRYKILGEIARGGMGVVYRAQQPGLNREVALKVIGSGLLASDAERRRFRAEAEAAARLEHPNIIPIHDVGEHGGQPYFTMKLVDGGSVAERLANRNGQFTNYEAAKLIAAVARAVHHAHQHGILHRDLKPANILLDERGEPYVTDFGLAKQLDAKPSTLDPQLTMSGAALGTPNYMAPEQARGGSKDATTAADIYSLGAILYELLCGQPPFAAATPLETLRLAVEQEPVPPGKIARDDSRMAAANRSDGKSKNLTTVDRDLETICLKCLDKAPGRRYATAGALADDLDRWQRREPILARPSGVWRRSAKWVRRKPALAGLVAVLIAALPAFTLMLAINNVRVLRQESQTRQQLYVSDMQVIQQAVEDGNLNRARRRLAAHRPRSGEADPRGFEWRHFWLRTEQGAVRVLKDAQFPLRTVAFSPDGRWLAAGGDYLAVWLWSTETWKMTRAIPFVAHGCAGLSFSSSGQVLALTSPRNMVALLDIAHAEHIIYNYMGFHTSNAEHARALCSPVGNQVSLVASNADGGPCVIVVDWTTAIRTNYIPSTARADLMDGKLWAIPQGYWTNRFYPVVAQFPGADTVESFTADGRLLVRSNSVILLWDFAHARAPVPIVPDAFEHASISPDGQFVIGCHSTNEFRSALLTGAIADGDHSRAVLDDEDGSPLLCAAFSPDGLSLAAGSEGHGVRFLTWTNRAVQPRHVRTWLDHENAVTDVAWSPRGDLIASVSLDGTVRLWAANPDSSSSARFVSTLALTGVLGNCVLSADGRMLAAQAQPDAEASQRTLAIWDLPSGKCMRLGGNSSNSVPLGFTQDGRHLYAIKEGTQLQRWRTDTKERASTVTLAPPKEYNSVESEWALSPDATLVASAGVNGNVTVWDANSGALTAHWTVPGGPGIMLAFSPQGSRLALTDGTGRAIQLWSFDSAPSCVRTFSSRARINDFVWSADGQRLFGACEELVVRVWDARTGRLEQELEGHKNSVRTVAVSPDGKTIAAGAGGIVKLWNRPTGSELMTLDRSPGAGSEIQRLRFAANGNSLILLNRANQVRFFDAPPLAEVDAANADWH